MGSTVGGGCSLPKLFRRHSAIQQWNAGFSVGFCQNVLKLFGKLLVRGEVFVDTVGAQIGCDFGLTPNLQSFAFETAH